MTSDFNDWVVVKGKERLVVGWPTHENVKTETSDTRFVDESFFARLLVSQQDKR